MKEEGGFYSTDDLALFLMMKQLLVSVKITGDKNKARLVISGYEYVAGIYIRCDRAWCTSVKVQQVLLMITAVLLSELRR